MTKAGTGAKLEDSNMASYGKKEHKDLKLAAAKTEKAWEGAGQKVGTEVWRIEKFKVVRQDPKTYGSFFRGDSYIVLNTYKPDPEKEKLAYNVHFWLGAESTQDEMGTAAYKTVELDDLLGSLPVQYREVDGNESKEFMDIFGGEITVLNGGIESGFNHVKPEEYKPRLFHMKGKKQVRVQEVPLSIESLNRGDTFLLDLGMEIIQWNGPSSGTTEKLKGREVIHQLRDDRNGKPTDRVLDGLEDDAKFWATLNAEVPPSLEMLAEETSDENIHINVRRRMFEVSDKEGKLKRTKVKFQKKSLHTDEVFIVDCGTVVYCWVGKGASKRERANGLRFANDYLVENDMPKTTPIVRVMEDNEPASFSKLVEELAFCDCNEFKSAEKDADICANCKLHRSKHSPESQGIDDGVAEVDLSSRGFSDCEKYEPPVIGDKCISCMRSIKNHTVDAIRAAPSKDEIDKESTEARKERLSKEAEARKKAKEAAAKAKAEAEVAAKAEADKVNARQKKMSKFLGQSKEPLAKPQSFEIAVYGLFVNRLSAYVVQVSHCKNLLCLNGATELVLKTHSTLAACSLGRGNQMTRRVRAYGLKFKFQNLKVRDW
eukprot:g47711.t1